jgi:hypothetical protein
MSIEIHEPRLEALIEQRMASGQLESVEDLLLQALEASPVAQVRETYDDPQAKPKKQNLADFLVNSPLRDSGIVIERSKDAPRIIEL